MAEEELSVQLQILSTAVKIYITHPDNFLEQLSTLFKTASENTDNPDLRDRAFIYWRLLNLGDLELAKEIVMGEKPQTQEEEDNGPMNAELAEKLIPQIGMITSVLWDTEERLGIDIIEFMPDEVVIEEKEKTIGEQPDKAKDSEKKKREKKPELEQREIDQEDLLGLGNGPSNSSPVQATATQSSKGGLEDLLDIGIGDEIPSPVHSQQKYASSEFGLDLMDLGTGSTVNSLSKGSPSETKNPPLEVH